VSALNTLRRRKARGAKRAHQKARCACDAYRGPGALLPLTSARLHRIALSDALLRHRRFRLLNLRAPGRFVLYRGGLSAPVAAAESAPVEFLDYDEPTGMHLALSSVPGEVNVHWSTRNATLPAVRWGPAPNALTHAAPAATRRLARGDVCGDSWFERGGQTYLRYSHARHDGWLDPGALHSALMTGLEPGGSGYYSVGDAARPRDASAWSTPALFTLPPAPGAESRLDALVVADLGVAEPDGSNIDVNIPAPSILSYFNMPASTSTKQRMAADVADGRATMLLHAGDISYARGFGSMWDAFFESLAPISGRVPYMTAIGNHEQDWSGHGDVYNVSNDDSGGECGAAYDARLPMPGTQRDQPWYSFEAGPVHFTVMSTEHVFAPGSVQYDFLAADLAGVNRSVTPWLLFIGHRPFVIDSPNDEPVAGDTSVGRRMVDALEPLWRRCAVDLTITGHHHSYQRTCALLAGECVVSCADGSVPAPTHIVAGHGGAPVSPVLVFRPRAFRAVRRTHGYLRLSANAERLFLSSVSSDKGGRVMDTLTLRKPADGSGLASCAPRPLRAWDDPSVRVAVLVAASAAAGIGIAGALWGGLLAARAALRRAEQTRRAAAPPPVEESDGEEGMTPAPQRGAPEDQRPLLP
jgi:hypothetical protein